MAEHQEHHHVGAYDRMLERLHELLDTPDPQNVREGIEAVKQRSVEEGELDREEADRVGEYLRRDVENAAQYAERRGDKDYAGWLQMDLQMLENWVWDRFTSVADRARVELAQMRQPESGSEEEYRAGEVSAPGVLSCVSCGTQQTLKRSARIPPCPNCAGTRFVRAREP